MLQSFPSFLYTHSPHRHVTDLSLLVAEWQVDVAHALTELGGGDVAMVVPVGQGRGAGIEVNIWGSW